MTIPLSGTAVCDSCHRELPVESFYRQGPRSIYKDCIDCRLQRNSRNNARRFARDREAYVAHTQNINQHQRALNDATRTTATKNQQPWTSADDEFLRDNAATLSRVQLATALGRTRHSVASRLKRLGIRTNRVRQTQTAT